jgi:hypothetical protein
MSKYYDKNTSQLRTSNFLGEVQVVDIRESKAVHYYNPTKKKWEHRLNGNWWKTEHAIKEKKSNKLLIPYNGDYVEYDDKSRKIIILTHDRIEDNRITHNIKTFNHESKDSDYNLKKGYEVVHIEKVWKPILRSRDKEIFRYSKMPGNVVMYLSPIQMRKLKK